MSESAIFKAAVKLAPQQRTAYLDQACAGNPELRSEVEALLRAHDATGGFLRDPPAEPRPTVAYRPITEGPGTVIGPYKLLQQIGEGGMGVVYLAEQTEPVRRRSRSRSSSRAWTRPRSSPASRRSGRPWP
jgi:hypothetical protein